MNKIYITIEVIRQIKETIGTYPIESGGIIGGSDTCITHFCFDASSKENEYTPNVSFLNGKIKEWADNDVSFLGIIHSHPSFSTSHSKEDLDYAIKLKEKNPFLSRIIFPIVILKEKDIELHFYELVDKSFIKIPYEIKE